MSNAHDAHDSHGGPGADHVPHVTPITHYLGVFVALLTLTAITVGVSYLDFGPWNLVIALVVATMKATAVAAIFMHLLYDLKFHALVFSFSLIFLAIFITFTSFDTFARGRAELVEGLRPLTSENPFPKDGRTKPMMAPRVPHYGQGTAHGAGPAHHGEAPAGHGEAPAAAAPAPAAPAPAAPAPAAAH